MCCITGGACHGGIDLLRLRGVREELRPYGVGINEVKNQGTLMRVRKSFPGRKNSICKSPVVCGGAQAREQAREECGAGPGRASYAKVRSFTFDLSSNGKPLF